MLGRKSPSSAAPSPFSHSLVNHDTSLQRQDEEVDWYTASSAVAIRRKNTKKDDISLGDRVLRNADFDDSAASWPLQEDIVGRESAASGVSSFQVKLGKDSSIPRPNDTLATECAPPSSRQATKLGKRKATCSDDDDDDDDGVYDLTGYDGTEQDDEPLPPTRLRLGGITLRACAVEFLTEDSLSRLQAACGSAAWLNDDLMNSFFELIASSNLEYATTNSLNLAQPPRQHNLSADQDAASSSR